MRTIKFRGKSILTDVWFYGDLVHSADKKRTAILVNDKDIDLFLENRKFCAKNG